MTGATAIRSSDLRRRCGPYLPPVPRIVNGPEWSPHGGWVVVSEWMGSERVVFDPDDSADAEALERCRAYVARTVALICA